MLGKRWEKRGEVMEVPLGEAQGKTLEAVLEKTQKTARRACVFFALVYNTHDWTAKCLGLVLAACRVTGGEFLLRRSNELPRLAPSPPPV